MPIEAIAAVNRAIIYGLKRHLCFLTTFSANNGEHFPSGVALLFADGSAMRATRRLIHKAFFGVKFLLGGREQKFLTTFLANQGFVCECHF